MKFDNWVALCTSQIELELRNNCIANSKFWLFQPVAVGVPKQRGSIIFCPPLAQREPPTKTLSAFAYQSFNTPIRGIKRIFCDIFLGGCLLIT